MPKKAVKSGTQGRKNKDLKMHIDFTGSNKVSIRNFGITEISEVSEADIFREILVGFGNFGRQFC